MDPAWMLMATGGLVTAVFFTCVVVVHRFLASRNAIELRELEIREIEARARLLEAQARLGPHALHEEELSDPHTFGPQLENERRPS